MQYIKQYMGEVVEIVNKLDLPSIAQLIENLVNVRAVGGRVFVLGVGGSAGNASHLVNDLRKIANIETYAPTDNVSELTARTNDDGFHTVFSNWLAVSKLCEKDAIFILSVGGGNAEKNVSVNLVEAIKYAKSVGSKVLGIVGKDGGYTAQQADACVIIPTVNQQAVTPHAEAFQAVIWHMVVMHPEVQQKPTKWESTK